MHLRKYLACIGAALLALGGLLPYAAASEDIEKIVGTGADTARFVWVVLAEGYTEAEQDKFRTDVAQLTQAFFEVSPWQEYKSAINVYSIFAPSESSGADHPSEGRYVTTAFDATYDTYGIARLLTVDEVKAFQAASAVPQFDTVFVLVNDPEYGGSGGSVIAVSSHQAAARIALHEAGHVIGKLADEYETPYPGYPDEIWEPNVTFETELEHVPWKDWILPETPLPTPESETEYVGVFEGARYRSEDIYRPKATCMMRSISQPYCEVCREALILNLYNIVSPIERFGPADARLTCVPGTALTLWVEPLQITGTFEALWEFDQEILENAIEQRLTLYPSLLTRGEHTVSAWIGDATDMVKNDAQGLLTSSHAWHIAKEFCSGRLSGNIADTKTGKLVANALVTLADTAISQRSDLNGFYDLPDVACAEYVVAIEADGFKPNSAAASISDAGHVTLDIKLEPSAGVYYISGSIHGDMTGAATITLAGEASVITATAATRDFVLGPVKPGNYLVQPSASGHLFIPALQTVSINTGDIDGVDFAASKTASQMRVAGVVQGDIKRNVVIAATGVQKATTITDFEGNFKFENLSAGAYMLTPVHPGVLFEPAQQNIELRQGQAATILFWAKESPCAATALLTGRESDLQLLRQLRDTRLKGTAKGRFYVEAYYLASPEISRLLQNNAKIRQEALRIHKQCLPILTMVLQGKQPAVPAATLTELKIFVGHVARHASPMLQKLIAHFVKDLDQGSLLAN